MNDTPNGRKRACEWRGIFLEALRNSANVRAACKTAGISRSTAYSAKKRSERFRKAWEQAIEDAVDTLEAVAMDRARKQSDSLLMFMLKAHRPAKYRETIRTQHTGPNDEPIKITFDLGKRRESEPDDDA